MLASCVAPLPALEEHEGSCDEDFVKSFIPSLFDSDSDADDGCCLQSPPLLGAAPPRPAPLDLPGRHGLRHLHVLRCSASTAAGSEGSPEASSPSSAGGASSLSAFTGAAFAGSEASGDEAPSFQSMLSLSSAASALALPFEAPEKRPVKRARVADAADSGLQPLASVCSVGGPASSSGLPRCSSLTCLEPQQQPVRLCAAAAPPPPPPLPPAPWVTSPVAPPSPCLLPPAPGPWPGPQGMIPTAPITAFLSEAAAAAPAPAAVASQQQQSEPFGGVAAALQELSSPLARPPLGLKLDKAAVAQQLRALGMTLIDA